MSALSDFLHGGPVEPDEIARVRDALLFEGPESRRRLGRFFMLVILATAIATYGLLADSVATVIGAMIVAPLMVPIMGTAFGVSLGDRRAILGSLAVTLLGIAAAILAGYLLAWPTREVISPEGTAQIMARTAPRLIDLFAAIATGLAGAYATGRKDVSDTLPGVAIAISLVPPLANVGILLAAGRPELAQGSLLLFVTNLLAILLTGALMFGLMGYPRAYLEERSHGSKRTAIALVVVLLTLITLPLGVASFRSVVTNMAETRAAEATEKWLLGSEYRLVSTKLDERAVRITIVGQGRLPAQAQLKSALDGKLLGLPVELEIIAERLVRFETAAP